MNLAADCPVMIGMSPERTEDMRTVVEACVNAMEHGNANPVATTVSVIMTMEHDRLAIDVADQVAPVPDPPRWSSRTSAHRSTAPDPPAAWGCS